MKRREGRLKKIAIVLTAQQDAHVDEWRKSRGLLRKAGYEKIFAAGIAAVNKTKGEKGR